MFCFAELSAEGWTLVIGAVFFGVMRVFSMWLDYNREIAKAARDAATAAKVEDVKTQLTRTDATTAQKLNEVARTVAEESRGVAGKVAEVKGALDATTEHHKLHEETAAQSARKLTEMESVIVETHALVNSNMAVQLKISAVALRRIADLTKHAGDIAAADMAETLLKRHEEKQASVDAEKK